MAMASSPPSATATAWLRVLLEGQLALLSVAIEEEVAGVAKPEDRTPPCSTDSEEDEEQDRRRSIPPAPSSSSWGRHRLELQHAMDPGFILLQRLFRGWRACSRPRLALRKRGQRAVRRLHDATVGAKCRMERAEEADAARVLRKGLRRLRARVACREAGGRLAEQHRTTVRASALHAWRAALTCQRHAQKRARRLLAQSLAAWRLGVAADKEATAQLDARLRLKRAWVTMCRAHVARTQWADAAVCRLVVLRARRCLRRWHWEATVMARTRRVRGSMAATLRRQVLARRGLRALAAKAAAEAAAVDALASAAQARAVRARAVRALWRLRDRVTRQQRARLAASRVLMAAARQRFGQWRTWMLQQGWERAAVTARGRRARAVAVASAFQRWRMRVRLLSASAQVRDARRRRVLGMMLEATTRSQELRAHASAVAKQNGRRRLRATLEWWRRMARFAECQRVMRQRRAWRQWRLAVAQRVLQRGIEEELGEGHATARSLRSGWDRWRALVAEGRVRRALAATEQAVRQRVAEWVGRAALLSWRRAWADEAVAQEAEAAAARSWRLRQLRVALTALTRLARGRELGARMEALAQHQWEHRRRRRGLVALQLHRWTAEGARGQAAMARRWRVRRGLVAWRAQAERQRAVEDLRALGEATAERQWLERRLGGAFGRLHRLARIRRQGGALQQATLGARRVAAWDAWRTQVTTLRTVRRFQQRSEREWLRQLLFAWAKWSHGKQRRRAALLRDARREAKRKAFAEWRARVLRKRQLALAALRVAENARAWRLHRAFVRAWREAFKAADDDRAAQRQFLRRRGLRPWLAAVQQRKKERWRAQVVAVTHARRTALAVLAACYEALADAARMRAAAMHHAKRLLRRRWVLASQPRRIAESSTAVQADAAWARGQLTRALDQWKEHVARRRRARLCARGQLGLAAYLGYWRRWVARCRELDAWRERVIRWSIERPALFEAIVGLVPSGSKRLALQAWAAFSASRTRQREALADADLHHARPLALGALRGLAAHAQAQQAARLEARQKLAVADGSHLRTGLRRWRRGVAALRVERQAEADRRRLRKLLRGWAEHTRHMKMARAWLRSNREGPQGSTTGQLLRGEDAPN